MFKVSCIQLRSNDNLQYNLKRTEKLISKALKQKTDFIITPEASSQFSLNKRKLNELTPEQIKVIIKDIIHKHLGWLVVWGGVFGFLIGLVLGFLGGVS